MNQINRNDPCPCGSGKKYKKCCGDTQVDLAQVNYMHWRRVEGLFTDMFYKFIARKMHPEILEVAWQDFGAKGAVPENEQHPYNDLFERWSFYDWKIRKNKSTQDYDGMTIARATLSETKDYMTKDQRRVCEAVETSPFSYYLVLKVVPNVCMHLKDLLRKTEVLIYDIRGSREEALGLIFYGRVITLDDVSFFMGFGCRAIPATYTRYILEIRKRLEKKFKCNKLLNEDLLASEYDLRHSYFDFCEAVIKPPMLANTDGDPFEAHTLYYQTSSATETFHALKHWEQKILGKNDTELLEDAEFNQNGELISTHLQWLKEGNRTISDWENTILGNLEINENTLKAEVNSAKRAKRLQKEIQKRLGDKVVLLKTEIESVEGMRKHAQEMPEQDKSEEFDKEKLMKLPEVQAQIKEMAKKHWGKWLDTSIPALNNITPREAAQFEEGKELLEALLLNFEQHAKSATNNIFNPDVDFLKKELGLKT